MKCNKCKKTPDSVCPCTITLIGKVKQQMPVPAGQGGKIALPGMPMGAQQMAIVEVAMPFETTVFLCEECNRERVAVEIASYAPMPTNVFLQWMQEKPMRDREPGEGGVVALFGDRNGPGGKESA
jgi:hypothetical protein